MKMRTTAIASPSSLASTVIPSHKPEGSARSDAPYQSCPNQEPGAEICANQIPSVQGRPQLAFTRVELLVIAAVLMLLAFVVLPALAGTRPRSDRVICANNLRQIGAAQHLWGNDHNDLPPVMVPVAEGGTRAHPLAVNTWLHFAWNSNELATPKVLFCPRDTGRPAEDFSTSPSGGYVHPNFQNRATSYFTSYSRFNDDPQWAVISGDRNVTIDSTSGCSLLNSASSINLPSGFGGQWMTNLHNQAGNVQFRDGRVAMLNSFELKQALGRMLDDNASKHLAMPR